MTKLVHARHGRSTALAPMFVVALIQLVVTIVLYILWGIDSIHIAGCHSCDPSLSDVHRYLFLIPTAFASLATIVCIPIGYLLNRSLTWVPLAGVIVTFGAYAISRWVGYQGI